MQHCNTHPHTHAIEYLNLILQVFERVDNNLLIACVSLIVPSYQLVILKFNSQLRTLLILETFIFPPK